MEKALLLERLAGLVAKYRQHRNYIEKAQAQAATGKFKQDVIEKVILDHEIKATDVAADVGPLLPQLHTLIDALVSERTLASDGTEGVDEQIQELDLRLAIGELDDDAYNAESADLRGRLDGVAATTTRIDSELAELRAALGGWADIAAAHGHYTAPAASPVVDAPAIVVAEPEGVARLEPSVGGGASTPVVEDADEEPAVSMSEDIGLAMSPAVASVSVAEEVAIETSEGSDADLDGDGLSEEVSFGAPDEAAAQAEVEIDLGGDAPAAKPAAAEDDAPRRALLLYQEGTAEEQIYPFTNDKLSIGRGRENDIQIKNDSKVSRHHCMLQRRGNNFYIEDAKSSNGTLVNGELITDRRLFGGEEIIIGETFFRFRIME